MPQTTDTTPARGSKPAPTDTSGRSKTENQESVAAFQQPARGDSGSPAFLILPIPPGYRYIEGQLARTIHSDPRISVGPTPVTF
jgi:hypothetical protein